MTKLINAGLKAAMALMAGFRGISDDLNARRRRVAVEAARAVAGGKLTREQMDAVRAAVARAGALRTARGMAAYAQPEPALDRRLAVLRDRLVVAGLPRSGWPSGALPALLRVVERRERAEARRARVRAKLAGDVLQAFERCSYRQPSERWCDRAGVDTTVTVVGARYLRPQRHWSERAADEIGIYAKPEVVSSTQRVWDSGGKRRSGTSVDHRLIVRMGWRMRVMARGLDVVDGMLTLDAEDVTRDHPALAARGFRVFLATWVEQGRGLCLETRRGYLALYGQRDATGSPFLAAHGGSAHSAVRALEARIDPQGFQARRRAQTEAARQKELVRTAERLAGRGLLASFGPEGRVLATLFALGAAVDCGALDLPVTLRDSTPSTSGNCVSGTRDWVAKHAPGRSSATVRELLQLALDSGDRFDHVLAACLFAIRRQARSLVRLAAQRRQEAA